MAAAAMITVLPIAPVGAQVLGDAGCWRGEEIAAARIQDLQTMLMVDALKCRTTLPAGVESYNKFMDEKGEVVSKSKRTVQAHFVRQYGSEGMVKSTDYDTKRSNETAAPIVNVHSCDRVAALSRIASRATDDDLLILAETLARSGAVNECPVPAASIKPAGMVIEVWKVPAPLLVAPASQPPVAVLAPAVVIAPTAPPVTPAVASSAASVTNAIASNAAPATNADAVKALQAAVLALSQVAATLQTKEARP
ncbi:hypothetical protein [Sphingomonas bacterium]|uniref:hypothetical protein n=1 Tax=Sphingomonas bacterium TaxID=1895847 RepID=UPI00157730EE|nr:hypothetical protein [Sphingomonas bacterium]